MLQVHPALIIAFVVVLFVTAIYLVFFEGHEDDWRRMSRLDE
jgi:hypothetical protein